MKSKLAIISVLVSILLVSCGYSEKNAKAELDSLQKRFVETKEAFEAMFGNLRAELANNYSRADTLDLSTEGMDAVVEQELEEFSAGPLFENEGEGGGEGAEEGDGAGEGEGVAESEASSETVPVSQVSGPYMVSENGWYYREYADLFLGNFDSGSVDEITKRELKLLELSESTMRAINSFGSPPANTGKACIYTAFGNMFIGKTESEGMPIFQIGRAHV